MEDGLNGDAEGRLTGVAMVAKLVLVGRYVQCGAVRTHGLTVPTNRFQVTQTIRRP